MQYFFANGSEQRGPYSLDELAGFGLRPDTLVWREGLSDWQRADSIPELVARTIAPPAREVSSADTVASDLDSEIPLAPADQTPAPSVLPPIVSPMLGYQPPPAQNANGMAIASLVLGIISIPSMCFYALGIVFAVLAIVFGFIARSRSRRENLPGAGMALAGLICGFVSIGLMLFLVVIVVVFAINK